MSLRQLPSVDRLLSSDDARPLIESYGRPLVLAAIRHELSQAREDVMAGQSAPELGRLLDRAQQSLLRWLNPSLAPVINATGVILHTNLGRAPLSQAALEATREISQAYSSLEYELEDGGRGRRQIHVEGLLQRLTGAEAALIVNNNAGAVLLALAALASGRQVIVSRTQLIEIGGGFRIPDILAQSGAELVEVGTTNRTHLRDYEDAIGPRSALILRAHHSNFQLVGFTTEPGLDELAQVAQDARIPLLDDLGSGTMLDTVPYGLTHEPTVQESLHAGADLVTFSGDKLLGGPQAGLVVGKEEFVAKLRKHPLARALRPDKMCLAAMVATLTSYLRGTAETDLPVWRMIGVDAAALKQRVQAWRKALGVGEVVAGESTIGGGSLPGQTLPTWLWSLAAPHPDRILARLRQNDPALIARIEAGAVLLDPRTVFPEQDGVLIEAVKATLAAD